MERKGILDKKDNINKDPGSNQKYGTQSGRARKSFRHDLVQ